MRTKLAEKDRQFVLCTGQAVKASELSKYPTSHIIGELCLIPQEGMMVTGLAIYESSRLVNDAPIALPSIKVYAIGDAIVECRRCGNNREWEIGRGALLSLMARLYKKVLT